MTVPVLRVSISAEYSNRTRVLRDAAFEIAPGEVLALVGESGSGKSTIALSILRLLHLKGGRTSGEMRLDGQDLMALSQAQMRSIRGSQIGLVVQSPVSALNPVLSIATQMTEAWRAHARGDRAQCADSIRRALDEVNLPTDDEFLHRKPSQLSVGQAQRVIIAMAVLHRPRLLLADEPTSALDVITQSEILSLFADLNRRMGMAMLFISHDLLSVARIAHRIAILDRGEIVECDAAERVFCSPQHPYTQRLVDALPVPAWQLFAKSEQGPSSYAVGVEF